MVCCFMCSCCYLYQRRQQRGRTPFDGEGRSGCRQRHEKDCAPTANPVFAPQPSRSPWPPTQCSPCMTLMENHWDIPRIHTQAIRWHRSIPACPRSTQWCSLVRIHRRWWIPHTVSLTCDLQYLKCCFYFFRIFYFFFMFYSFVSKVNCCFRRHQVKLCFRSSLGSVFVSRWFGDVWF